MGFTDFGGLENWNLEIDSGDLAKRSIRRKGSFLEQEG